MDISRVSKASVENKECFSQKVDINSRESTAKTRETESNFRPAYLM